MQCNACGIDDFYVEQLEDKIKALEQQLKEANEKKNSLRRLVITAVHPMFDACGNSYINAWLEKWLEAAKALDAYDGETIGNILDVKALWDGEDYLNKYKV